MPEPVVVTAKVTMVNTPKPGAGETKACKSPQPNPTIKPFPDFRQWTHVFKILCGIDPLYEYYGHFYHMVGKIKNTGGTVQVSGTTG